MEAPANDYHALGAQYLASKGLNDCDIVFMIPIARQHSWSPEEKASWLGVFVSPLVRELGIDSAPESLSDGEFLLHEIKTFLTWLAKGRPVVLEMIFHDGPCYVGPYWDSIKALRSHFITLTTARCFINAVQGQLKRHAKYNIPDKNEVRIVFWQIWRTLHQTEHLLLHGEFTTTFTDELLQNIESDKYTRDDCVPRFQAKLAEVQQLFEKNPRSLPESCDMELLDRFLLDLRRKTLENHPVPPEPTADE